MSIDPATILVGVDGSSASREALVWAMEQALTEQRSLTLVHAAAPAPEDSSTRLFAHVRAEAPPPDPDLVVHEEAMAGDPREVLLELSGRVAMLVLGSRGRGPMLSALLGSTSVAVVRRTKCPVVVHRPGASDTPGHGIVVGIDASAESLEVLDFAFRQASLRAEPLSIVHTRHFPDQGLADDPFVSSPWGTDEDGLHLSDKIAHLCEQHPDVVVTSVIAHGTPERLVMLSAEGARLLVVGIHHRGRTAELTFGSLAVWLVEHARCPVAAVPLAMG